MMRMGEKMGRQSAHELLHSLSMEAFETETSLRDLLKNNDVIMKFLTDEEIDAIMSPENYIGEAAFFAEKLKIQADQYFARFGISK